MATHYNVKSVTDGLVLALDAANPKSYPGSGTTWSDLSGNGNNGTLVNTPTYSSTNGGSLTFNGSSQYAGTTISSGLSGSFTFCCFVNVTSITTNGAILASQSSTNYWAFLGFNPSNNLTFALFDNTNNPVAVSSTNVTVGTWCYLVGVRDIVADTISIFFNGINTGSVNDSTTSVPSYSAFNVGGQTNVAGRYANCKIGTVQIYNRALSASEVLQNYNALKSRYIAAPTLPAPTLPDFYEQLTYIVSGNLTATGNGTTSVDIFKTSGSSGWDNQAYSTTAFSAPCTIEFNKQAASTDNSVSYAMIGWNEDPTTDASYTSLDYASFPYVTNSYAVYHNGTQVQNGGTWDTANKLYVVYGTDGFIRHYNGSTLLYSANYGTGRTVYVDSSFYSVNSTFGGFSNIKVIRSAWNGVSYV